ncbi:amidase [Halobaculum sp. P14]|uniref:amidase n=1 Tax=Halobaculum sp. P14 TaxID=3421638 RepID=UPI003EBD90C5
MKQDAPADADRTARRFAERARELPGDDTTPAFAAVEPTTRADPYGAFATSFVSPESFDGPLSDLSVAVKDNVAVRGVAHGVGTASLAVEADRDATVVERIRASGADLVGTTRMDPFALGVTGESGDGGRTVNPAAVDAIPGGSSAGSAAAVAGGLVDAALGTDTAGSVRVPASFCGAVGVKPTFGRVPRTGVVDLAPTLDHVGVVGQDVETAARLLDRVSGRDPLFPSDAAAEPTAAGDELESSVDRLRIGVPEPFAEAAARPVRAVFESALTALAGRDGVTVERLSFPEHGDAGFVNQLHTVSEFAAMLDGAGQPLSGGRTKLVQAVFAAGLDGADAPDRVRELAATGRALNEAEPGAYSDAWGARRRLVRRVEACFDRVDVLVTPTTPTTAPDVGTVGPDADYDVGDLFANTAPFNCTGNPAVSVPCGDSAGRPVGVQIVAPTGADEEALRAAREVESVVADGAV